MLPWLAVMFGGILGNPADAGRISREVSAAISERAELAPIKLPSKDLRALTHHAGTSRAIVAKLEVDGLIAGELIEHDGALVLRMVVYTGEGGLRSLTEIPLRNRVLGLDDLAVIRTNLSDEAIALAANARPAPKPAVAPPPKAEPRRLAKPKPRPAPAPAPPAAELVDDETPAGLGGEIAAATPRADADADDGDGLAEDPEVASAEELDALVEAQAGIDSESEDDDPVLGMRVAAMFGFVARNFAPGPATVPAYSSSPVGTLGVVAQIRPSQRIGLDALAERTMSMTTPMGTAAVPTTMSRWEVSGDYALTRGRVVLAARLGLGRRSFAIDTDVTTRTPDGTYNYLIAGASVATSLGHKLSLIGTAAFEPVLWGTEPTEMAFGEATRWAFDVGAAVELRPRAHVYARVAADYQRFAWDWSAAGARGAGGAVDQYPTGSVSLGAEY